MPAIRLSWPEWRRLVATRRAKGLADTLDHTALPTAQRETPASEASRVALTVNEAVYRGS
jgi:hypothetical protein